MQGTRYFHALTYTHKLLVRFYAHADICKNIQNVLIFLNTLTVKNCTTVESKWDSQENSSLVVGALDY